MPAELIEGWVTAHHHDLASTPEIGIALGG
jgi:hypothetical protein